MPDVVTATVAKHATALNANVIVNAEMDAIATVTAIVTKVKSAVKKKRD